MKLAQNPFAIRPLAESLSKDIRSRRVSPTTGAQSRIHNLRAFAHREANAWAYEALARRHPKSRIRGRKGTAAEIVLRLLVLKHVRNWSYEVLEREVRANLVYRDFTRVGGDKVPDAKTMGRWGVAVGPQVLERIHARIVTIARENGVIAGRSGGSGSLNRISASLSGNSCRG